jgi:hypothetical protein
MEEFHQVWDLPLQSLFHHQLADLVSYRPLRRLGASEDISATRHLGHLITISCPELRIRLPMRMFILFLISGPAMRFYRQQSRSRESDPSQISARVLGPLF